MSCPDCKFSSKLELYVDDTVEVFLSCCRNPPQVVMLNPGTGGLPLGVFPIVNPTMFCGEFQLSKEVKLT